MGVAVVLGRLGVGACPRVLAGVEGRRCWPYGPDLDGGGCPALYGGGRTTAGLLLQFGTGALMLAGR